MLSFKRHKNPEPGTTDPKKLLQWTPTNMFIFTYGVIQLQAVGLVLLGSKYCHIYVFQECVFQECRVKV